MKKIFSITAWIIFVYTCILLSLSLATTQKTFYSFIFKSFLDIDPSFNITESNWHPIKPSILITYLKSENDRQLISADEIFLQFSLFNISRAKFISRLSIDILLFRIRHMPTKQEKSFL